MTLTLVLIPAAAALLALFLRHDRLRRALLVTAAALQAAAIAFAWQVPPAPALGGWIAMDAPGRLFLSITSGVFLMASIYAAGYLSQKPAAAGDLPESGHPFGAAPEAVFTACLLLFQASMSLITLSQHLGLLWVAVEASTLASAPLIYYHRTHRSLEAVWKYLMVCSVGVALALLGNFFLAVAADTPGGPIPLLLNDLIARAPDLQKPWLRMAFILVIVGYGTKMGLAPLHNWLPDAHSESPSLVSALLSGALLNCAFLGILRTLQVLNAAGIGDFGRDLLVGFGLLSIGTAMIFIFGQADYKRMLAYSSVEHMGVLALGVGLGGAAAFGAMLHAVNHSLTKAMLFFLAGNILTAFHTKSTREVRGLTRTLPITGRLWIAGFLAIAGSPPFGLFLSEFTIFRAAVTQHHAGIAAAFLAMLALIFAGMGLIMLRMSQGPPLTDNPHRESWWNIGPPFVLALSVLILGVYIPSPLNHVLREAARALGGL